MKRYLLAFILIASVAALLIAPVSAFGFPSDDPAQAELADKIRRFLAAPLPWSFNGNEFRAAFYGACIWVIGLSALGAVPVAASWGWAKRKYFRNEK